MPMPYLLIGLGTAVTLLICVLLFSSEARFWYTLASMLVPVLLYFTGKTYCTCYKNIHLDATVRLFEASMDKEE